MPLGPFRLQFPVLQEVVAILLSLTIEKKNEIIKCGFQEG